MHAEKKKIGKKRNETQNENGKEKRKRNPDKISVSAYTNGVDTTAVSIPNAEGTRMPNVVHTRVPATAQGHAD